MESPLARAGMEKMNVSISFCSPLNLLNILSNFVTRSTLKIRAIWGRIAKAEDAPDAPPAESRIISKIEAITTKKSKMFHPERK